VKGREGKKVGTPTFWMKVTPLPLLVGCGATLLLFLPLLDASLAL